MKAQATKFNYAGIEIEGLLMPNGDYRIAVSQVAKCIFPTTPQNATKYVKTALGEKVELIKTHSDLNSQKVNTISIDQFFSVILFQYNKKPTSSLLKIAMGVAGVLGKDASGLEILHKHNKNKKPRKSSRVTEKEIQVAYQTRLGGQIEVQTPLGNIDLLTDDGVLYEFKYYKGFKEALGQVLTYSRFVETKKKVILLFGIPKNSRFHEGWDEMKKICDDYGIELLGVQ